MATYTGYVTVPHSSYAEWKSNTLGNFYDADGQYGCQCYDFVLIFWNNVGFPEGYPLSSTLGASGIWSRRNENIAYNGVQYFDLITNLADVKQGDIICYSGTSNNEYGHIGFADVNYASWTPDPDYPYEFPILSENNGGEPYPAGGTSVNVHGYDTRLFQGAFRYREWQQPAPITTINKTRLPLILTTRSLINPNSML